MNGIGGADGCAMNGVGGRDGTSGRKFGVGGRVSGVVFAQFMSTPYEGFIGPATGACCNKLMLSQNLRFS